jgi:hypothetical protein
MVRIAEFVLAENMRQFQDKLMIATDPTEIRHLNDMIIRENEIYKASLRIRGNQD